MAANSRPDIMARLLLIVALVAALVWTSRQLRHFDPAKRRHYYWQILSGVTAVGVIILAASGRLPWVFALLMALLPAVQALLPALLQRSARNDSASR